MTQICALSDCFEIISGGTPSTKNESYWDGDIPWLSVKDFKGVSMYVYSSEKTITKQGLENSATNLLQKDDIILSARGTVGEVARIPYPMAFNQSCYGLRPNLCLDSTYGFYLIKNAVNKLKRLAHGSVFDTITRDTFETVFVEVPPLETQRARARILSILDRKIHINNLINDNLV